MAVRQKFNPDIHMDWAWSLAIRGATDAELADAFGVSVRTIHRWKFEVDENGSTLLDEDGEKVLTKFGEMLLEAKEVADAKVEKSLFNKAVGYSYTEEEKLIEYGMDGEVKPVKVRTLKKHMPPDTMAIMYWLNNRKRKTGEWSQRQETTITADNEIMKQIISISELINNPESDRELPD